LNRTSGATRRIAGALALVVLAASPFGMAPSVAGAGAKQSANFESVCGPATPGTAQCLALRRTDIGARPGSTVSPLLVSPPPGSYGPADIQSAYALPSGTAGSGMTVAVVDAYDLPTAEADLAVYRSQYSLPPCTTANGCFRKVNQDGVTGSYPTPNAGWGQEIALDIEMVSATCPNCKILLVEADSANFSDLGPAVNTAVAMGAIAVSNSYGGDEGSASGEAYLDANFYNHPGVAITASTGDCGYACTGSPSSYFSGVEYPAASPYVVAVGGTRLTRDGSARGWTESAWGNAANHGGAGSGCSLYEPKPSWQQDAGCAKRTQADVSAVADPATYVAIYDSYSSGGWGGAGGTSAGSPIIAATFALAGRPAAGTYPASYLYAHPANLNDVIGGNNDVTFGTCTSGSYLCNGVAGYDGPTGLGTPNGIGAFTAPANPGATYHALTPTRILDTRDGTGLSGAFGSHSARTFQVAGVGGVPANATAVTGNLTVTAQTSVGYLYIGPNATNNPTSSTLNFPVGDDRANGVTVALGAGTLSVTYVGSTSPSTAHVIFDVTGYFTPDMTGSTYHALSPARILDTRNGTGLSGAFGSHSARTFQVAGVGGVPANATAVTGNLTVTSQTSGGYLYIGPNATNDPTSSTLNFPLADDRANGVTVALGGGTLSVTYVGSTSPSTAHVIFDVTGYFTPDMTGSTYHALTPARILDTRNGTGGLSGPFSSHAARTFGVSGAGGVPANATAVTGNLTVTSQTSGGYLYIGPNATNNPTSSTLNFPLADDRANGVTVALGGGTLSVTYVGSASPSTAHVIFDVTGYFTP
jgi:subtilase family serine protease